MRKQVRSIGAAGASIPKLAWGMWRLADNCGSVGEADRLVRTALDCGITLLDTADIYGSMARMASEQRKPCLEKDRLPIHLFAGE